jgi:hypothetical protein
MTDVADVLLSAEHLEREGREDEALRLLVESREAETDADVARHLVALRHRVGARRAGGPGREPWPPTYDDPFGPLSGPPEVPAGELDHRLLGGGILHHGCLLVRGLVPSAVAGELKQGIDDGFAERDAEPSLGLAQRSTYLPYDPGPDFPDTALARGMVGALGGLFAADCPTVQASMLRHYDEAGALTAIADYLGEQPVLMFEKGTLRRVPPFDATATYHQDAGALGLDSGVRTVNLWLSLSHCGGDAKVPALEIVPHRYEEVFGTTESEEDNCTVPFSTIDRLSETTPPIRPVFEPGDALLFDELFIHRTGLGSDMTGPRYAIESWFFAPSSYPEGSVPLAV